MMVIFSGVKLAQSLVNVAKALCLPPHAAYRSTRCVSASGGILLLEIVSAVDLEACTA